MFIQSGMLRSKLRNLHPVHGGNPYLSPCPYTEGGQYSAFHQCSQRTPGFWHNIWGGPSYKLIEEGSCKQTTGACFCHVSCLWRIVVVVVVVLEVTRRSASAALLGLHLF